MPTQKLAVIRDYPEEQWHSMDLCAEMLAQKLQQEHDRHFRVQNLCPSFRQRFQKIPGIGHKHSAFNGDRLLNRFWDYPRYLRGKVGEFDFFHIADHSYAHLVHELPGDRTGVFCHDLDTFRCLLEPELEPRPFWFRAMAKRILTGLQKASVVFYSTLAVKEKIEQYKLLDSHKLIHNPYGISAEFTASLSEPDPVTKKTLNALQGQPFLLHVGSCIPRKRIDWLLTIFSQVRSQCPQLKLVKVGGGWSAEQKQQIEQLHLRESLVHLQGLERRTIASLYRQASLVLLTSEAEGFGLPVIESLACGANMVASDIPVLREVGGSAVVYCPVGNIEMWVDTILQLLSKPDEAPGLNERLQQAQKYSWSNHAQTIAQAYLNLL